MNSDEQRHAFLLQMYRELWNNINRHLVVMWQSAGVLGASFAVLALVERGTLSLDVASTLLILVAAWLIANAYDANSWFNRNLLIISNIERQFLKPTDAQEIHFYFTRHREPGAMIDVLRVHRDLGVGIGFVVLSYHFVRQVVPGLRSPWSAFAAEKTMPYLVALICIFWVRKLSQKHTENYKLLLERSPGRVTEATDLAQKGGLTP